MSETSIREYLESHNIYPERNYRSSYGMYLSPIRYERKASFKVDYIKDVFYDFSIQKGGGLKVLKFYMNNGHVVYAKSKTKKINIKLENKIWKIQKVVSEELFRYAFERKIAKQVLDKYCVEIHYGYYERYPLKALGFKNDSEGYEFRFKDSKERKGCLINKDITTYYNSMYSDVCLFEGFMDFFSFKTLYPNFESNYLILNSTSQVKKSFVFLNKHQRIFGFLDLDSEGDRVTGLLNNHYPKKFYDKRSLYKGYGDLNEYLIEKH
ncbi:toprim domain-containing protein [Wenyingzhuangia aestuarii]|uniref:toprim domain-containing protein n=1 Tax=Wenyingzhuangia aestuarii TaxID=1647582 RepID=UPI00143A42A8|nr:toprim domain-containing protein [Wenyingzhuangia aestuarii]NJB82074.1 hypothetical protein [Wenyingzhuangia aestuarii]